MNLLDNPLEDYILMRKLNFKNWKIVDVDHYMKGNSFFKSVVPERQFIKNIDHYLGAPKDRVVDYTIEQNYKDAEIEAK